MTKNGQNMAKMEKIRNIQMTDNKEDKFFYFPMVSMGCTGSGYTRWLLITRLTAVFVLAMSKLWHFHAMGGVYVAFTL